MIHSPRYSKCAGTFAVIKFRFNPRKAVQAVHAMLDWADEPLDFHTILKAAYFADCVMLNAHGRPIFGASYRAMNYGPVPLEIYELLKSEPYWLSELGQDDYPWSRTGFRLAKASCGNNSPGLDELSRRELEVLKGALDKSRSMSFDERTRDTHGMDWVLGSRRERERMAYEDMIDPDHPFRAELIEDLEAMGTRIVL